jgi:hypothetical protein
MFSIVARTGKHLNLGMRVGRLRSADKASQFRGIDHELIFYRSFEVSVRGDEVGAIKSRQRHYSGNKIDGVITTMCTLLG